MIMDEVDVKNEVSKHIYLELCFLAQVVTFMKVRVA